MKMDTSIEINSKKRIINSAIDLFSTKGFFETSVREIAQKSNLKVSSIYSHFPSKEAILDYILETYRLELLKVRIPDDRFESIIINQSLEEILNKGFLKILETTADQRMNKIIKILLIELYRNSKVRNFYEQWFLNESRDSVSKIFERLQERGAIKKINLELLSSMYLAMVNFYYHQYFLYTAENKDTKELELKIKEHLQLFVGLIK
jgi:AcrR family transcriptional regulator